MNVSAHREKCEGYGNCVVAEPRVFDLDDEGFVKLLLEHPPEELREEVKQAVRDCPTRALTLDD